jgi:hypothetical protein
VSVADVDAVAHAIPVGATGNGRVLASSPSSGENIFYHAAV